MTTSMLRSTLAPVGLAGLWIAISEFLRNELWSFVFAICIHTLLRRFTPAETIALSWGMGFGLMWLVTGNMAVLPFSILIYAVPLSLLEIGIAVVILRSLSKDRP